MLVLQPSSSGLYRIAAAMKITGETVRRGPTTMPPSALKWAERALTCLPPYLCAAILASPHHPENYQSPEGGRL